MNQLNEPKMVIGSDEWCAFPSLNIPAIKARVDSGAKTSSMHAINILRFTRESKNWVSFEVHPLQKNRKVTVHCEAPLIDQRIIKSSSGDKEQRPVIRVPLSLGEKSWEVEVTLTNRDSMGYRMLLGREAMNGRILIDPEGICLLGDKHQDSLRGLYRA
jgi:ribosomal protein S6--L-glutamate ligase